MRIKENVALEFNEFSKNYTNDMIGCVPHYQALINSLSTNLPAEFNPMTILDLGCGTGNATATLLPYFPNAQYTLLDASDEMIELCKKRFANFNLRYVTSYFKDYAFAPSTIDLLVAGFSLHHCDSNEKRAIFQSVYSTLKSGGLFSMTDLMINKAAPAHEKHLEDWKLFVNTNYPDGEKWEWLMEHYEAFDKPDSFEDQSAWLTEAGFNHIEIPFQQDHWIHVQAFK